MLNIIQATVEYMENPIGIENKTPRFSWQINSEKPNTMQTAYRIIICLGSDIVWDSTKIADMACCAIVYGGEELKPCSRYSWKLTVWDNNGEEASLSSRFETGFMDESLRPWENAKWIGQEKPSLYADTKGVFAVEARLKILGSSGGIVFGAGEERLRDKNKNIMGVEGESRISYEIDISSHRAKLIVKRLGYCKADMEDHILASTDIADVDNPENTPITPENKRDWHTLRVEVYGNTAKAFVDGICVDGQWKSLPFLPGKDIFVGRQLNPLADNDTITFPRLNHMGFTLPRGGETLAMYATVTDLQEPCAKLYSLNSQTAPSCIERDGEILRISPENDENSLIVDPSCGGIPIFRREFKLNKDVRAARLYISARGIYDGVLNGKAVAGAIQYKELDALGDRSEVFLQPGASQFDRHLFYNSYDITDKLLPGDNALSVLLSSGWWCDSQTFSLPNHNYFGDRPSFMAKLSIEYTDGSIETIVTDTKEWKLYEEGPIRYSAFFAGERYDARREAAIEGCYMPGFDTSGWKDPVVVEVPRREKPSGAFHMWPVPNMTEPKLVSHPGKPVKLIAVACAQSVKQVKPGIFVYDMGQNLVAVPHIKLKGNAGDKIWLRYGEVCYPYLEQYGELGGMILTENLRDAESSDIYFCKGDKNGELMFPRFTFHGYRYVEISGTKNPPLPQDVKALVISSFPEPKTEFSCNNKDINRLFQNILWSQRANFISIPTDCPQRNERMGWMGDAQVFAATAAYNDDVRLFFERYLVSVRDLQLPSGQFPCIAPIGGGFGGVAWESAGLIIPWTLYRQYGDIKLLRDNFSAMLSYGEYLLNKLSGDILSFADARGGLGDWLATDLSTDTGLIWNAIAIYDMEIIAKSAAILGESEAEKKYSGLYKRLKLGFNRSFFNSQSCRATAADGSITDTQCAYALPLYYGLYTDENRALAAKRLAELTKELGHTLTTGFIGTPCIAPALEENGYTETAYKLLSQSKYPSWLYPVSQGATTIWERWNSYTVENGFGGNNAMNSFNHYSLGAVGYWMISGILGIKPQEQGFQHIRIAPAFNREFGGAKGYYNSPWGKIMVGWQYSGSKLSLELSIPANTRASLRLPKGKITSCNREADLGQEQNLGSGYWKYVIDTMGDEGQ